MTLALSTTNSPAPSPSPAPARPIAAAKVLAATPGQPGLVFSDAIGWLDGSFDLVEALPAEAGLADAPAGTDAPPVADGDGAASTAGEMSAEAASMPAALTAPAFAFGMVLSGLAAPALADAAAPLAGTVDGAVVPDEAARPAPGGGLAARAAALSPAGAALAMLRPATGEGGMPLPRPALDADGGDAPAEPPPAAVARKTVGDALAADTIGSRPEPASDARPSVAASVAQAVATAADGAATPAIKLAAGTPEQWRRPLLEALGERIRVEIAKRSEHAVIRLDPPMMGHIEIVIRHEAGSIQIQLSASNGEVLRQLQNISDSLRQDLAQRQYADVSVHVFAGSGDGDGRRRPDALPDEEVPGQALAEAEAGQASSNFILASDRD